jgi:hypothetical protein
MVPWIFTALILIGLGITGTSPPCTDPAGCIWLRPGEPVTIGFPSITSGTGLSVSLSAQQGAELAAARLDSTQFPGATIQPFFSPCLPELGVQSTIELTGAEHIIAVLGPTCLEDAAEFGMHMSRAGRAQISPLPYSSTTGDAAIFFWPDPGLMAQQAVGMLFLSGINNLSIIADPDPASQTFREAFCTGLENRSVTCENLASTSTTGASGDRPALVVWISLQSDSILPAELFDLDPGQPALAISLSPPKNNASRVIFSQWLGPAAWQNQDLLDAYSRMFQTHAAEFASLLAYSATGVIHQAALETAERLWDGSWLIPRHAFEIQLRQAAAHSSLYQYSCPEENSNCQTLPLALFQWTGKDYRFINP